MILLGEINKKRKEKKMSVLGFLGNVVASLAKDNRHALDRIEDKYGERMTDKQRRRLQSQRQFDEALEKEFDD